MNIIEMYLVIVDSGFEDQSSVISHYITELLKINPSKKIGVTGVYIGQELEIPNSSLTANTIEYLAQQEQNKIIFLRDPTSDASVDKAKLFIDHWIKHRKSHWEKNTFLINVERNQG